MNNLQQSTDRLNNPYDKIDVIIADMDIMPERDILDRLIILRHEILKQDGKHLRDAASVLIREGKAFQRDLSERLDDCLDGMDIEKTDIMPVPLIRRYDATDIASAYETKRRVCYAKVDSIRAGMSDESLKRALYMMLWELPEDGLENVLILIREAVLRYTQMHKNLFNEHRGIREIRYRLALIGITEVLPESGEEFDPGWHIHSDSSKTGFDYRISKTVHAGYKRNGRKLLKAIVEVV